MRYLDSDGDLARARRQLRFIKLFLTEQLKHYGLTNAVEIYRFWTSVDSDISTKDMAKLVYAFGGTNVSDFSFYILPGESSTIRSDKALDNADYWVYDPDEDLWYGDSDDDYTPLTNVHNVSSGGSSRAYAVSFSTGKRGFVLTGALSR